MTRYGVFINCSKYPFLEWILSLMKPFETRTKNTLKAVLGLRVALIQTGNGKPMVVGYATVVESFTASHGDVEARKQAMIFETDYDIKPGKQKIFYRLINVEACTPYPVPENRTNHGRAYTEFTEVKA